MTPTIVLVVEDEPLIGLDLQESLEERGFVVIGPCRTAAEALVALATFRPHVALVDVLLPGETTESLVATLVGSSIPFATFTGQNRDALPETLRAAPYISKPADMEALAALLGALARTRLSLE